MKIKNKITEDNYQEVVLKRLIIICWVLLAICFVIKLFGGNFFEIMCTNKTFIKFCDFVDKYYICLVFEFVSFILSSFLIIKCANMDMSKARKFIIFALLIVYWCFKTLITLGYIKINFNFDT